MDYYDQDNELEALERILIDSSVEPIMLSFAFLKLITNNFSEEIGRGGFGIVYMGFLRNGKVAVKKLSQTADIIEEGFKNELICLIKVKHKNIVRFLGYCSDTQEKAILHEGQYVLAEERRRYLCFEYVPNKSLHDYLKDETHGHEWDTRYQLIQGIFKGLCYLHNEEHINHLDLKPENILLDADMVPKITDFGLSRRFSRQQSRIITKNIRGTPPYIAPEYWNRGEISSKSDIYSLGIIIIKLLRGSDESFDFEDWHNSLNTDCQKVKGCITIAKLCVNYDPYQRPTIDNIIGMLNEMKTPIQMVSPLLCPSRNNSGSTEEQTYRSEGGEPKKGRPRTGETVPDVGCLGIHKLPVVSEPASPGTEFPRDVAQAAGRDDVISVEDEHVPGLPNMPKDIQEINAKLSPVVKENHPSDSVNYTLQESSNSMQLIRMDNGNLKTTIEASPAESLETSNLQLELDLYPLELHFPFKPNKLIKCPVTLTNKTDHHIGVWITPISSYALHYYFRSPRSPTFEMVEPHSTLVVSVTLRELLIPPLQDRGKFEVLMVAMRSEQHLKNLNLEPSIGKKLKMDSNFVRRVEELGGQVHRKMLTAIICDPASRQAAVTYQTISTRKYGGVVYSLDVHPTETWILMGHGKENVSIWNYQTKERVMAWQATLKPGMVYRSPQFSDRSAICSAKFIARKQWFAVGDGYGSIFVYAYTAKHWVHRFEAHCGASVNLLVVHPTSPFLLSASYKDNLIKLWDWDQRWVCTRKFSGHTSGVDSFRFNPRDTNIFASVANDNNAKVWNIDSSDPVNTLPMVNPYSVDFFHTDSPQHFLVTCSTRTKYTYIWDLKTKERVHRLGVGSQAIQDVAFHPALPLLVTRLRDGTVCLWDATTYRLMDMVQLTNSPVRDMVFIGTKEITRLVVGCAEGTAIIEINFPTVQTGGSENVHHMN